MNGKSMRLYSTQLLILIVLALLAPRTSPGEYLSQDPDSRLSTVPHDNALAHAVDSSGLGRIAVRHEGWNETLYSWSRIKLEQLTGRTAIHGQNPVYSALSLMYEPERWYTAKIFPVEHPRIASLMGFDGKWVSQADVVDNPKREDLRAELQELAELREERKQLAEILGAVRQAQAIGLDRPGVFSSVAPEEELRAEIERLARDRDALDAAHERRKALEKRLDENKAFLSAGTRLLDRVVLATTLPAQFLIVPDPESRDGAWVAARSAEARPASLAPRIDLLGAGATLHGALAKAFAEGTGGELAGAADSFLASVQESRHYPTQSHLGRKNFYVRFNPTRSAAWFYAVALGLFGLFLFFQKPAWRIAAVSVMGVGLAWQTLGLVMRLLLTGHLPVSNMYESIVFTAWSALALGIGIELWNRKGIFGLFTSLIGFLALMGVGLMPLHETRIHPLRAVLNSYWLNIHVTAMLISYGAFAIAAVFALAYLAKSAVKRDALLGGRELMPLEQIEEFSYRLVQIGWPVLTVGICLGGVWADTAWGRFWGWDPKETWALITWITYTVYLHTRMVMGWKGRISAIACVVGFFMVLITWIGVSYLPWFAGGLHTYASPGG